MLKPALARGELRKEQIKELWALDDEAYEALKQELGEEKLLEPMRGVGGFSARIAQGGEVPQIGGDLVVRAIDARKTVPR